MFDITSMMGKLQDAQQKMEQVKQQLDLVLIDEQLDRGALKVTLTANRKVKSIEISDALLSDKEQLEDYLIIALNKALDRATAIHEQEMASVAMKSIPDLSSLGR